MVATLMAGGLVLALFEPLRRQAFELFYRLHWVLFVLMIFAVVAHGASSMAIGVVAWLIDLTIRFVWMASLNHAHQATLVLLPADVIRVIIPNGTFKFRPGQYIFLCVPEISIFEW